MREVRTAVSLPPTSRTGGRSLSINFVIIGIGIVEIVVIIVIIMINIGSKMVIKMIQLIQVTLS